MGLRAFCDRCSRELGAWECVRLFVWEKCDPGKSDSGFAAVNGKIDLCKSCVSDFTSWRRPPVREQAAQS